MQEMTRETSFGFLFYQNFYRVATVLEIREMSGKVKKGLNSQGKVRELTKMRKVWEMSVNFDKLSEPKSSLIDQVQLVDLGFFQIATSRGH